MHEEETLYLYFSYNFTQNFCTLGKKLHLFTFFFASIFFKMQYSNMLLLLMALMQACSVNRNLSNAITIVCVIH